ncbi:GNAT family N-acetyltransferase [Ureibacillus sp. MALMAid1270]|uniref:GNAT family N-acetyltransferase n=1 Tax=Ureibacillus sp. MALMAid1270 TaxID=3411629 RepID=UPI003BA8048E
MNKKEGGFLWRTYKQNPLLKNNKIITLRTALPEDAKQILKFIKTILKDAPFLLTTESEFNITDDQHVQFLKQMLEDNGKLAILAEYQGNIIGFLDFHNGGKKRIQHQGEFGMSISEAFRNQGVGRALLTCLLDWAKDHPLIEKVCLEVFAENTNAIALYKKFGFVEEGRKQ